MNTRTDQQKEWCKRFGVILQAVFDIYEIDYTRFADAFMYNTSTIRYWIAGRNLPSKQLLESLRQYILNHVTPKEERDNQFRKLARNIFFEASSLDVYNKIETPRTKINYFIIDVLMFCYNSAKGRQYTNSCSQTSIESTGKTQVIVFDFDGTLTSGKSDRTTWEYLWIRLGYDVKECHELHRRFNLKEISHDEWCKLTEIKFKKGGLRREHLNQIARKTHLIKGARGTLKELKRKDIRIYIVSGSIYSIISDVLGSSLQYIDAIKANSFTFDADGNLESIVGTEYDFEGKAEYIKRIANELRISCADILFVGNSINDQFAYVSGAQTLCINPKMTDPTNTDVWHDCIFECTDLKQIMNYIKT